MVTNRHIGLYRESDMHRYWTTIEKGTTFYRKK